MAILFEWYENPGGSQPATRRNKTACTHHTERKNRNRQVATQNPERCSLTETDVSAVLDALSHAMGEELAEGRQVHLDGIGYFHPTPDLHGRNKRRYKTEEYESKAERHQIPGGSGTEK